MMEFLDILPPGLLITFFLWEIILFSLVGPVVVLAAEVHENRKCENPEYLQLKKYRNLFRNPGEK